jgi:glucose-6-phosphate 1-dehydrogenase
MRQEAASLQERRAPPSAVVIFGASGDLTQRKLVPALANLVRHRRVTSSLTLIGVGRSALSAEEFRREVAFNPQVLAEGGLAGDVQYLRGAYDDLDT